MQTRTQSLIEASLNIGSGFIVSMVVWQIVGPWFGYEVTLVDNLGITGIFTVVSITRSYIWRRIFNSRHSARENYNKDEGVVTVNYIKYVDGVPTAIGEERHLHLVPPWVRRAFSRRQRRVAEDAAYAQRVSKS